MYEPSNTKILATMIAYNEKLPSLSLFIDFASMHKKPMNFSLGVIAFIYTIYYNIDL
jgi:hypothetical protein